MNGEPFAAEGNVRLMHDPDPRFVILESGGRPMMRCATIPHWWNDDPVYAAKMVFNVMRPLPPRLDLDGRVEGVVGGMYLANSDAVLIFGRREMSDRHLATLILHEASHSTGHPSRCGRECFRDVQSSDAPLDPAHIAERFRRRDEPVALADEREELVASLAASFVCVSLGILPTGSAYYSRWLCRAARLPSDALALAIREAYRAASFLLNDGELWCAEVL